MTPVAFPLTWPDGWPRTPALNRQRAKFRAGGGMDYDRGYMVSGKPVSIAAALDRLEAELGKLGAASILVSTNVEPRLNGMPRSGGAEPADTGAAVYFTWKKRPMALACDRWNTVGGNIAALAAYLGAMRAMDRWGVGSLERAFTGYLKLAGPASEEPWQSVLGYPETLEKAEANYRLAAQRAHPDRGGSHAAMARLTAAIAAARKELSR